MMLRLVQARVFVNRNNLASATNDPLPKFYVPFSFHGDNTRGVGGHYLALLLFRTRFSTFAWRMPLNVRQGLVFNAHARRHGRFGSSFVQCTGNPFDNSTENHVLPMTGQVRKCLHIRNYNKIKHILYIRIGAEMIKWMRCPITHHMHPKWDIADIMHIIFRPLVLVTHKLLRSHRFWSMICISADL